MPLGTGLELSIPCVCTSVPLDDLETHHHLSPQCLDHGPLESGSLNLEAMVLKCVYVCVCVYTLECMPACVCVGCQWEAALK